MISGCRGGEAAPGAECPELAVRDRGRSVLIEAGFSAAYAADTAWVAARSSALAEASSAFIATFVVEERGLISFSRIPRCAKLKFPEPMVSTAGLRDSIPPCADVDALSGPMTSSPPPSAWLSSSFCCCWPDLFLLMLLFAMVLLRLLAAFCAAEKTEAKKPP